MKQQRRIAHTAAALDAEVKKATKQMHRPSNGDELTVLVAAQDVETRPELFQPRSFGQGLKQVDENNVHKLMRLIGTLGELDPIDVVKLGQRWVCVDGHHRVEAYKRSEWKQPIKATWFAGDVRAALDHAITSNLVVKLDIPDQDRYEAAWQRVVLGWGSKPEIARRAVVSERLVGNMRAIKAKYDKGDDFSRKFRDALGAELKNVTWRRAKMAHDGVKPGQIDKNEAGVRLAKELSRRLDSKLSEDPEITAIALAHYDRYLTQPLAEELRKFANKEGEIEIPTYPRASFVHMPDHELRETVDRIGCARQALLRQQREAEAEQDRRNSGGTAADETWDQWIQDAPD
jgi:hypothetical protein